MSIFHRIRREISSSHYCFLDQMLSDNGSLFLRKRIHLVGGGVHSRLLSGLWTRRGWRNGAIFVLWGLHRFESWSADAVWLRLFGWPLLFELFQNTLFRFHISLNFGSLELLYSFQSSPIVHLKHSLISTILLLNLLAL